MSLQNLVLFLRDDIVTVRARRGVTTFDYIALRDTIEKHDIKEGSYVLCGSSKGEGVAVVEVVEILSDFVGDAQSSIVYQWIFQRVRTEVLEDLHKDADQRLDQVRVAQRAKQREQLSALLSENKLNFDQFTGAVPQQVTFDQGKKPTWAAEDKGL